MNGGLSLYRSRVKENLGGYIPMINFVMTYA